MTTTLQPSRLKKLLHAEIHPWVLVLIFLSPVGVIVGLAWWNQPPPGPLTGPLYERFNQIKVGMTQQEVQDLFDIPPDKEKWFAPYLEKRGKNMHGALVFLKADVVFIFLDSDKRVVVKEYFRDREDVPSR